MKWASRSVSALALGLAAGSLGVGSTQSADAAEKGSQKQEGAAPTKDEQAGKEKAVPEFKHAQKEKSPEKNGEKQNDEKNEKKSGK